MPRRFEGWEGIIHGGILCTILDEVMAWALVVHDNWGVTARMSIDFRKPVTVGQAIRAEGWITEARRRIQVTAGRIVDSGTGVELAAAEATYVAASRPASASSRSATASREPVEEPAPPYRRGPTRPPANFVAAHQTRHPPSASGWRSRSAIPTPSSRPSQPGFARPRRSLLRRRLPPSRPASGPPRRPSRR